MVGEVLYRCCEETPMKSLKHHAKRLIARMMQAEKVTSPEQARKILRKAEKHKRKLDQLHSQNSPPET